MEKDGENSNELQEIQPQPRNLEIILHPPGILMDPPKTKHVTGQKLPAIKQAGHQADDLNSTRQRIPSKHTPGYLKEPDSNTKSVHPQLP
jgi:hypothetical protein